MKSLAVIFLSGFLMVSCASSSQDQSVVNVIHFTMPNAPLIGTTLAGQKIKLGGFSGLQFIEEKDGSLYFETITDRGPNGEPVGSERSFLLPDYSPEIVKLKADLNSKELTVVSELKLKKLNGASLTGLPNSRKEENPIDVFGFYYSIDSEGLDIEGLTSDQSGGYWVADEYGPSLAHFDEKGKLQKRLVPGVEVPRMYTDRKPNRGFEGITKIGQKLFAILQSPLPYEKEFSRIVEIDLETMKVSAEYYYSFENGNDKIGDISALPNTNKTLLVLEQNGKVGEKSQKFIYKIELGDSDTPVKKTLVADLKFTPFNDLEKIEGIAAVGNKRIAIIYDNDFEVDGKADTKTGLAPMKSAKNQMIVLEFKEKI